MKKSLLDLLKERRDSYRTDEAIAWEVAHTLNNIIQEYEGEDDTETITGPEAGKVFFKDPEDIEKAPQVEAEEQICLSNLIQEIKSVASESNKNHIEVMLLLQKIINTI